VTSYLLAAAILLTGIHVHATGFGTCTNAEAGIIQPRCHRFSVNYGVGFALWDQIFGP
jgi:sterol desaturase/sphingolipid hydroxylase (fatty acid hydroxylase superfamily)